MAPRLTDSHEQIISMMIQGFSNKKIAGIVPCTPRAVRKIRLTYERFGTATVPANRSGPDHKITPAMWEVLCHQLAKEPDMQRQEMVNFINDVLFLFPPDADTVDQPNLVLDNFDNVSPTLIALFEAFRTEIMHIECAIKNGGNLELPLFSHAVSMCVFQVNPKGASAIIGPPF